MALCHLLVYIYHSHIENLRVVGGYRSSSKLEARISNLGTNKNIQRAKTKIVSDFELRIWCTCGVHRQKLIQKGTTVEQLVGQGPAILRIAVIFLCTVAGVGGAFAAESAHEGGRVAQLSVWICIDLISLGGIGAIAVSQM